MKIEETPIKDLLLITPVVFSDNRGYFFESFKNKNILFPLIIGATLILLITILYIPVFANFFHVSSLNLKDLGIALLIAMVSVLWFEGYKWIKRRR